MTRVDAKRLLKESPYPDPDDLKSDIDYFLKKMNWTEDHLQDYLLRPEKSHATYPSETNRWEFSYKFYTTFLRRIYKRYNAE